MSLNRRHLLASAAAAGTIAAVAGNASAQERRQSDLIRTENQREGTTDWQLTYTRVDPKTRWRSTRIEGYVSKQSVRAGESLDFFVSTNPPAGFVIDIYRMGYYQGKGARHMRRLGPFEGKNQPTPPVGNERVRECQWESCTRLTIPKDWPSGVYLGKLSATSHRYQSYIIFILRDNRPADFLFQCSDNTWQAYNQWPDSYSLYTNDRKDRIILCSGVKVSFDRPYGKYVQIYDNPLSQGSGE